MEMAKTYYCHAIKLNPDNMRALYGLLLVSGISSYLETSDFLRERACKPTLGGGWVKHLINSELGEWGCSWRVGRS